MIEPLAEGRVRLALGGERLPLRLPAGPRWVRLEAEPVRFAGSRPLEELDAALEEGEIAAGRGARIAVVVPDLTRAFPGREVAAVLARRRKAGARLQVLVACGVHRPPSRTALAGRWGDEGLALGPEAHDADATPPPHARTRRGTPVALSRAYREADFRITLGAVSFHYFAGFGGGPKLVFPGLASRPGALANHRLSLGPWPPGGLDPAVGPGRVAGNPVAEDLAEAAAHGAPELALHWLRAEGGWRFAAGESGSRRARAALSAGGGAGEARSYDVVVASAGGSPRDVDLVQSHKALFHAAQYVRDGGGLAFLAATPEGAGSAALERWLGVESLEELERRARSAYDGNAQTAISLRRLAARVRIHWAGSRTPAWVARSGAIPCETPERAIAEALGAASASGGAERGAVLPEAAGVVPRETARGLPTGGPRA